MELTKLKEYYNKIDSCSVALQNEIDFEYIQNQITKISLYTEQVNHIIGELLVEQTKLEHSLTNTRFEYELKFTQFMMDNSQVKNLSTAKERKDYINYYLMRDDYRKLLDLEQEYKDVEKLLDLARKKSKDLDRTYPKLKTLWESLNSEVKNIKKIGSDSEHINRVKNKINENNSNYKPVFTDDLVEEINLKQYDKKDNTNNDFFNKINDESFDSDFEDDEDNKINTLYNKSVEEEVDDLLKDL
jgi:hypothetical protein